MAPTSRPSVSKLAKRTVRSVLEHALPFAERLKGFRTAYGDYLPNRLRVLIDTYEANERRLMREFLRPGQTILDVGANVGFLTVFFARATGASGKVYAFEPNPLIFDLLRQNTAPYGQVEAINCGLSVDNVDSTLFLAGRDHSVASFSQEYPTLHVRYQDFGRLDSVQAKLVNGDQFLSQREIDRIDILKIDVEGWELNVLRGLQKTIQRSPEIVIFFEYNRAAQECAGFAPMDVLKWFFDNGYKLSVGGHEAVMALPMTNLSQWIEQLSPTSYPTLFATRSDKR
jgi:FkbM family methyltransferase